MSVTSRALNFVLVLAAAYVIVLVVLRLFESHFIFYPNYPGRLEGDWKPASLPVENVSLTTSDGVKLHGWWIPAPDAKFTFLAFHGNASNIANRADVYRFLHQTPANLLAVEYRGYGRSEGSPSESGVYRDAAAAYNYLVQTKGIAPRTIISFGQSLGTTVAAHLAANSEVGGVILEAPFPSLSSMARRVFWFLPGVGLAVAGQFRTEKRLQEIRAPILIVHCTHDPVVPPELAEEVYAAAKSPKFVLRVAGECHEESSLMAPEQYRAALQSFLTSISKSSQHD
jgi:fermentation-respiration switch protein FrsA (DUF1100 family)